MRLDEIQTQTVTVPPGYARGMRVPWWGKMLAKLLLARLPLRYGVWSRLGVFRHGAMDKDIDGAIRGWRDYETLFRAAVGRSPRRVVELGPGDSLARALCAAADGAERMWLIDAGDYATRDMAHYAAVANKLAEGGAMRLNVEASGGREGLLDACNAHYLTRGLASFAEIGDGEVELIISNSVLEHLPLGQFDAFLAEMMRVLAPGGMAMHRIDLQDHLGGGLESLRFPAWFWEHPLVARSGFYTNRLRCADILARFRRTGFETALPLVKRWPALPTARAALHREFESLAEDDLLICGVTIVLRK